MRKELLYGAAFVLFGLTPAMAQESQGDEDRDCGRARGVFKRFSGRLEVVGLTSDQRLVCFREHRPEKARDIGEVTGLSGDTRLVGIDFRPATGELYGLGDAGGVYTIDASTAVATPKSTLSVALEGTSFGVDFNPTVDRLRIISDTGQNLRVNVDTGAALVDTPLAYPAPGGPGAGVTGAAYTNNDADPNTGTTLYDIDSMLDQLVIQAPPNAGTLNVTGKLTVDTSAAVGFDIYSVLQGGMTTTSVQAFASLTTGGRARFYALNLFTGQVSLRGTFRTRNQVIDIALPLNQD